MVETDVVLRVEDDEESVNFGTYVPNDTTALTTTTTKVCIRLDSMPGSVKCYVRVVKAGTRGAATGSTTESIGIYSDEMLHTVAPMASMDGLVNPQSATADINVLGLDLNADGNVDASDNTVVGAIDASKLCNLFSEAAPAN